MNEPDSLNPASIGAHLASNIERVAESQLMLSEHLKLHSGYVAWSGGRDSTAALLLARQVKSDVPVVFFDSGLEFPETYEYINSLTQKLNLNLHIIKAAPGALTLLQESGLWSHTDPTNLALPELHSTLITVPSRQAHATFGEGEITGLRADESSSRRILLASGNGRYERKDGSVVCAPVWRWKTSDISAYLYQQGVPEHPVYAKLKALGAPNRQLRVGLLIDANGLDYGRATWLRMGWPELWQDLCQKLPRLSEWR